MFISLRCRYPLRLRYVTFFARHRNRSNSFRLSSTLPRPLFGISEVTTASLLLPCVLLGSETRLCHDLAAESDHVGVQDVESW
jgi:hypothetical protein